MTATLYEKLMADHTRDGERTACGLCGDATGRCAFERACACWRGISCVTVSPFVARAIAGKLPASDRTAGR